MLLRTKNYSPWTTAANPEGFVTGWKPRCSNRTIMNHGAGARKSVRAFTVGARKWIGSAWTGKIAVDCVLRLERLQKDFEKVCRVLGRPLGELPCRNWKFHLHYSHYYDEATQRLVGDYYAKDIEAFGYRFEARKTDLRWVMLEKLATRWKSVARNALDGCGDGSLSDESFAAE